MTPFSLSGTRGRTSSSSSQESTPASSSARGGSSSTRIPPELQNLTQRRSRQDSPEIPRPMTARASVPGYSSSSDDDEPIDTRAWLANLSLEPPPRAEKSPEQKTLVPASTIGGFYATCSNIIGLVDHSKSKLPSQGPAQWFAEPYIRAKDGVVRRFPEIRGQFGHFAEQIKNGLIYDAPAQLTTKRFAGLEVSGDGKKPVFVANGVSVPAIKFGHFSVYPLPGNRFMVPQPAFKDCSAACELMLLLDHGKVDLEDLNSSKVYASNTARDTRAVMHSIKLATGLEPFQVTHELSYKSSLFSKDRSRKVAWRDLAEKIDQYGPCILGKGGHMLMLDNVRESKGKFFLSIRDPFHGTSLEIQESAEFFNSGSKAPDHGQVEAIFLPSEVGGSSTR